MRAEFVTGDVNTGVKSEQVLVTSPSKAGEGKVNYGEKKGKVWESIVKNLKISGRGWRDIDCG